MLQKTGTVDDRNLTAQFLDNNDIERERGITIKLQSSRMRYAAQDGDEYILNLIGKMTDFAKFAPEPELSYPNSLTRILLPTLSYPNSLTHTLLPTLSYPHSLTHTL